VTVDDGAMIDTSFPGFAALMNGLGARITGPLLAKKKAAKASKPMPKVGVRRAVKKPARARKRGRK
jgi:hypothetical protein